MHTAIPSLRNSLKSNAGHVAAFRVFRALKAGATEREEVADLTGLSPTEVSRIARSRGWRLQRRASIPDLTEELV